MGFRFRKSFGFGPFRTTISKSGISTSVGVKGARITKRADGKTQTTVSIPGTGISHEVMGSMYEPFRTTKRKGNGLGLLIVRRIIKDHGGTLGFASKEGTGTTVTITLPRADRVVRLLPA